MQSFFHDGDKFLVTQFFVAVGIKKLKDDVYKVRIEALTCACLNSSLEFSYTQKDNNLKMSTHH